MRRRHGNGKHRDDHAKRDNNGQNTEKSLFISIPPIFLLPGINNICWPVKIANPLIREDNNPY